MLATRRCAGAGGPLVLRRHGGYCDTHGVSPDIEQLCSRLDQISEDLADLAMRRLRDSIDAGGQELPVDEKLITRARRAVEKAAGLLRSTEQTSDEFS